MTQPSKAAMAKARQYYNAYYRDDAITRMACVLQEHSDMAKDAISRVCTGPEGLVGQALQTIILPDEPDVLALALSEATNGPDFEDWPRKLRAELAKRGLKIVEADDD